MANSRWAPLTGEGPLRLYSTAELLTLPPPEWLIDNVIPQGAFAALYGEPETYKSFVAADIAMTVGTDGMDWHGHSVQHGPVVYVAAEGGTGIGKRARAWLNHHNVHPNVTQVSWLLEPIVIGRESEQVDEFLERIEEAEEVPSLIIIDTLARCFEGEESETGAMTEFVAGVDRLRLEYGCTTLVVHHTRLGADRERGNSAFRAGADTMMSTKRADKTVREVKLVCDKQKDAEHFPDLEFEWKEVVAADSGLITSPDGGKEAKQAEMLTILSQNGPMYLKDWQILTQIPVSTFYRYMGELRDLGKITKKNSQWLVK